MNQTLIVMPTYNERENLPRMAQRLLNLPVEVNGTVAYSITRHDLLRAWIGLGVDIETNSAP